MAVGELATWIKAERRRLRKSVSAAAGEAKVHRATWTSWEMGTSMPADTNWRAIEDVLEAPEGIVAALLGAPEGTSAATVLAGLKATEQSAADRFEAKLRQRGGLTEREIAAALAMYYALKDEPDITDEPRKQSGT